MTLDDILPAVRPYTMVSDAGVRLTVERTIMAIRSGVEGDLVECGVWKGGCAIAMLLAQRVAFGAVKRPVHLMDSFEGMPLPQLRDGPAAIAYQAHPDAATYRDNCRADMEGVIATLSSLGFRERDFTIWHGAFERTLPFVARAASRIAVLRIDCDWYASVRPCLEALVPLVKWGGTVIVDDYFAWDGCARAVHDYLAIVDKPYRLQSLPDKSCAFFEVTHRET